MLHQSHQHYIINTLEPQLGDHADQYDLEKVAHEMLLWYPGDDTIPAGWFEDSTENLQEVLERNTIN